MRWLVKWWRWCVCVLCRACEWITISVVLMKAWVSVSYTHSVHLNWIKLPIWVTCCLLCGQMKCFAVFLSVCLFELWFFCSSCFISSLQKVYKAQYEKSRGFSINYCDTPKFQMDSVLKQFTDVRLIYQLISFYHKLRILLIFPFWMTSPSCVFFRHITKISMTVRWRVTTSAATRTSTQFTVRTWSRWRTR